jgi:perosamine synthetase
MIPVYEPDIGEAEVAAVVAALRRGEISGTFGRELDQFESLFAHYVGCEHGVAVTSGTTALFLAVAAAGIEPGDEVLVSASTNIATALAAYHNGAVPVPVDSETRTWNLDLALIDSLVTERTKAIIPVHLFGHPVDMDRLREIAARHRLCVIEDCAEAHGASVRGRAVGSLGTMGCFSFYGNKIITTGEGGMVTTDDPALAARLRLLRNLAFTQPRFRHEIAAWQFRMTNYQAAMGVAQLARIEDILARKRQLAGWYTDRLKDVHGLRLPVEEAWAKNVYWVYGVLLEPSFPIQRDVLMARLRDAGVDSRTFFCPMNQQPFLQSQPGYRKVECPVADQLWECGLYLPSSPRLAEADVDRIAKVLSSAAS